MEQNTEPFNRTLTTSDKLCSKTANLGTIGSMLNANEMGGYELKKARIRSYRPLISGYGSYTTSANIGTIGNIMDLEDVPSLDDDGMVDDMIINSNCIKKQK